MAAAIEDEAQHHYTVFVRLPFNRGDFEDPSPVAWSAAKERELWNVISRPSKGNDINWKVIAEQFQVSQRFLLQQAAWLYERQLSQVRAQMRRVGSSNAPSPVPPTSESGSMTGAQAMARTASAGSRVPSRLSARQRASPVPPGDSQGMSSFRARAAANSRLGSGKRPPETRSKEQPSRQLSSHQTTGDSFQEPTKPPSDHQVTEEPPTSNISPSHSPPAQQSSSEDDSSDEEESKVRTRRQQPRYRRMTSQRPQSLVQTSRYNDGEGEGSEDSGPFLPFATTAAPNDPTPNPNPGSHSTSTQDVGATLRGDPSNLRPTAPRRTTSERITSSTTSDPSNTSDTQNITQRSLSTIESSATSSSSSNATPLRHHRPHTQNPPPRQSTRPTPLSPRQAATLNAAGLSSRLSRRSRTEGGQANAGSDGTGTPSMGSSFSDLDDTSVTQSALEEALASNMAGGRAGNGNNGAAGVASRMSSISQALRSRYL